MIKKKLRRELIIQSKIKIDSKESCYLCGEKYQVKGLCSKCYQMSRRYRLSSKEEIIKKYAELSTKTPLKCYVCGDKAASHSLCAKCLYRARKNNLLLKK